MKREINIHKIFAGYFEGVEALAYALSSKLADGHICIDLDQYFQEIKEMEEPDPPFLVESNTLNLQTEESRFVSHDPDQAKPFIIQNGKAYLQRYFFYETSILENIKRLGSNFHIITGGPGTGKTYSVSMKLLELFEKDTQLKVALAAPTGKAAARMNEAIKNFVSVKNNEISDQQRDKLVKLKASTVHRLLGYQKDSVFFRYNQERKLPIDVLIIDECSMIDGALMAKLLEAVDNHTVFYLLGDKDQLASVEAGSVFGDMCRAAEADLLRSKVEFKTESRRFDPNRGIGKISREIINRTLKDIEAYTNDEQVLIDQIYDEKIFEQYAQEYLAFIHEEDTRKALKKLNAIRFLCVTRQHDHSVAETNQRIEKFLLKEVNDKAFFQPQPGFYHNQPVMVTKNNYELGVFNDDIGLIRNIVTIQSHIN